MIEWKPIETAPHNVFVLVACPSGYVTTPWCFFVAQYTAGYHDRWDGVPGDGLDFEPLWWTDLPNFPPPDTWQMPRKTSSQIQCFRSFPNLSEGVEAGISDLEVKFVGGGIYRYMRVLDSLIKLFAEAESAGSFLAKHIKGRYEHKKVK